jgi:UDP-N-acetylglucosamine acyltransferase
MSSIHPSAIIDPNATIHETCEVGPFSIIGPNVTLHEGVIIKSHVVIDGYTTIGKNTQIFPFSSIGSPTPDLKYKGEASELIIGENNIIREHVTMNPGTEFGGMKTVIGDNNLFMVGVHIAHDCILGSNIVMANNSVLGGHVHVGDHVWFGGLTAIHQFVRIGSYAVIGGMTGVDNDVIPFGRIKGERGYLAGLNLIRMDRMGMDKTEVRAMQRAFNQLFNGEGTMDERIEAVAQEYSDNPHIAQIIEFARTKDKFPLCPPKK